jgi:hypothetical protein
MTRMIALKGILFSLSALFAVIRILVLPGVAFAEEPAQREGDQSLEQAASDPTASLMSIQIQDQYSGDYYKADDERGNSILLRSAVPDRVQN